MNSIIIIRHGEAQDFRPNLPDFNRSLTKDGIRHIHSTAQALVSARHIPHHIIASAAVRTRQTAEIFRETFHLEACNLELHTHLYGASAHAILSHLNTQTAHHQTLMIVAHNPGVHELHCFLAQQHFRSYPTGGAAVYRIHDAEKAISPENVGLLMTTFG